MFADNRKGIGDYGWLWFFYFVRCPLVLEIGDSVLNFQFSILVNLRLHHHRRHTSAARKLQACAHLLDLGDRLAHLI
jgi:hypothetical protein